MRLRGEAGRRIPVHMRRRDVVLDLSDRANMLLLELAASRAAALLPERIAAAVDSSADCISSSSSVSSASVSSASTLSPPLSPPAEDGWVIGAPGENCDEACDSVGLRCDQAFARDNMHLMDSEDEYKNIFALLRIQAEARSRNARPTTETPQILHRHTETLVLRCRAGTPRCFTASTPTRARLV